MSTPAFAMAMLALVLTACRPALRPAVALAGPFDRLAQELPLEDDGNRAALARALQASLAYYKGLPPEQTLAFGKDRVRVAQLASSLESFLAMLATHPPPETLALELGRRFVAYRATAPAGVLFTGYYLPALAASPMPDARFRVPVHGRPPDLVTVAPAEFGHTCPQHAPLVGRVEGGKLRPYFTRAEIAAGAAGATPIIAWVDDPIALFFLQIQGSGFLIFPDGTRGAVGFAASNGHPYVSIGRLLVEEGHLGPDEASMHGIRRWIAEHPEQRNRVLNANPRYVFFRRLRGPVVGSLGVPVTAERTIATDPAVYPPGALALIRVPADTGASARPRRPLVRLVLNQDAGAAISGPERVDIFFGEGAGAEATAGRLKTRGELYFLAPRAGQSR